MTSHDGDGFPPAPRLAPEASRRIAYDVAAATAAAGTTIECAWLATWDAERQEITAVEWSACGTAERTWHPPRDLADAAGKVALHNHPGHLLAPSQQDIAAAMECDALGIGFGIVSSDGTRLLLVRAPRPLSPPAEPRRTWLWTFGRWQIIAIRRRNHV